MKKILVTGGAGFIGSHLADSLVEKGNFVFVIDNLSTGLKENVNEKAVFYKADIRDVGEISKIFKKEKFDYVFHCAAQINVRHSIENPLEDAKTNILGSLNIIENCVKNNVKKIIFSSTGGAIYGADCKIPSSETEIAKPESPYGIAKLTIENYLDFYKKIYGLDYAALRYSNVYGPRQNSNREAGVISIFMNNIFSGKQLVINGSGNQTRDFIYVKDVVRANLFSLKGLSGIYNVGTGIETSVNDIVEMIDKYFDINVSKINGPEINGELMRNCLNIEKLKKEGWKPEYDLNKGIHETWNWFKNYLSDKSAS